MADTGVRGAYQFGPFQLDARERRLSRGTEVIPLRLKVFDTLLVLVENAGRLVTKQELLDTVWPETSVEENNLNHNVSVLRRALGNQATGQQYIETVPRVSYRFVARVEGRLAQTTVDRRSPGHDIASMAVLPFVNMSADPEGEYFSDGITEEITSALSLVRTLRVTSRTSAFVFKGRSEDVPTIGKCLKVGAVLEGSVRRAGNRIRITAQLVNTEDGFHLWSGRFDREMTDVFAVQEEIAQAHRWNTDVPVRRWGSENIGQAWE